MSWASGEEWAGAGRNGKWAGQRKEERNKRDLAKNVAGEHLKCLISSKEMLKQHIKIFKIDRNLVLTLKFHTSIDMHQHERNKNLLLYH